MRWHFRYIGYCLLFARKKLWLKHPNEHSVAFWSPHWTSSHLFILDTISLVLCNVFFAVHRRYITITFIQPFIYISFYCMAMFISFVCYYMCYFSFSSNCWCRNWKWLSKMRSYCNNLGRQRKWKHNWCFRLNFLKVQWVGQYFTRDSSVAYFSRTSLHKLKKKKKMKIMPSTFLRNEVKGTTDYHIISWKYRFGAICSWLSFLLESVRKI